LFRRARSLRFFVFLLTSVLLHFGSLRHPHNVPASAAASGQQGKRAS